jgi:hypothetical protein
MRAKILGFCGLVAIGVCAVASYAQQQPRRTPAPTTEAKFWSLDEQNQHQKDLLATTMTNWKCETLPANSPYWFTASGPTS